MFRRKCFHSLVTIGVLFSTQVAGSEQLVDPTRPQALPPGVSASGTDDGLITRLPQLQAVFAMGPRYSALIDGRRVYAGEELNGYRVEHIQRNSVTLSGPTAPVVLQIGGVAVKATSQGDRR